MWSYISKECYHFCKMPKRAKRAKVNDEPIILVDNPMKAKHAKPPVDEHGLCLANPARVLVVGGCGASKTTTILNCIARVRTALRDLRVQERRYRWVRRLTHEAF